MVKIIISVLAGYVVFLTTTCGLPVHSPSEKTMANLETIKPGTLNREAIPSIGSATSELTGVKPQRSLSSGSAHKNTTSVKFSNGLVFS